MKKTETQSVPTEALSYLDNMLLWNNLFSQQISFAGYLTEGVCRYNQSFSEPMAIAVGNIAAVESQRLFKASPCENLESYQELMAFNFNLFSRYYRGVLEALGRCNEKGFNGLTAAWINTLLQQDSRNLSEYTVQQIEMMKNVLEDYPRAILDIEPEYGFHFESGEHLKFAETDRFTLYRIAPSKQGVTTKTDRKPVVIIPPFVLGTNILAFLPGEQKSYAHSFANQGIPTYVRVMKDIQETPATQVMTMEEDALDTRYFCEQVVNEHGKKVTLNGYCQGGFSSVCNILSGKLDGLVDALITCVAPMDGTRSLGLGQFLRDLPKRFNDLAFGKKTLANGNQVADGDLMGWVYKLKGIDQQGPLIAFINDMFMVNRQGTGPLQINKTIAALNYWLQNERSDIPLSVTEMSFASYNIPVKEDGTLPVTMFGNKLNFKGFKEKNIKWLLCYGEQDDLVEKEVALAPLDFTDVEITPFPKGHVAIATSWSHPDSACALDTVFGNGYRGPVRFQLDLDSET